MYLFIPENPRSHTEEVLNANPDLDIVYRDRGVTVLNKPSGIDIHKAGPKSPWGVDEKCRELLGVRPVHRLDRDTSGIVLLAMGNYIRCLAQQFEEREVKKAYIALVDGKWNPGLGAITAPLTRSAPIKVAMVSEKVEGLKAPRRAATAFDPIALLEDEFGKLRSLLWVRIFTGRTHQIRVHLAHLGFPITGDKIYNESDPNGFNRQLLHAYQITFRNPLTEEMMTLRAPLPADFSGFVSGMRVVKQTPLFDEIMQGSSKSGNPDPVA